MCDEDLTKTELAKHVDNSFHRRVIRDRYWGEIEDTPQFQRRRTVPRRRDVRREKDERVIHETFLSTFRVR